MKHGTCVALRAYLVCPVCIAVTLGDLDQKRALDVPCAHVGVGQIALSLFRMTKLGN